MNADCGCGGSTGTGVTGLPPANRPGLGQIDYRRGTFATFRRALLDQLADIPELSGLRSRMSSDYMITLLELWSAVADVLAFYNDRTANEAFIRTATARDSVLRLVRLIDYHLAPGLAATTWLTFSLERGTSAAIAAGTRVQSVPAQGATAQKYEALETLLADAGLNALRVRPFPIPDAPTAQGRAGAVAAPDPEALLAVSALNAGDPVVLYAPDAYEVRTVASTRADEEMLTLTWDRPIEGAGFAAAADGTSVDVGARRAGRVVRLFGHAAPPQVVVPLLKVATDPTSTFLAVAATTYALTIGANDTTLTLDGGDAGLSAGATALVVSEQGSTTTTIPFRVTKVAEVTASLPSTLPPTVTGTAPTVASGKGTQLTLSPVGGRTLATLNGHDLRGIRVVELVGQALRFWPFRYPGRVTGSAAYVPGRRSGWSRVEVGRTVVKGAYTHGVDIDPALLATGRRVVALDAAGTPVPGRVDHVSILGSQVAFGATASDPRTVTELGLDPSDATPTTVLVSGDLTGGVSLAATRRLSLRIGAEPPALVTLSPSLSSVPSQVELAAALQSAVRLARPESPAFALASVWELAGALAVSAGVPGTEIAFGPSADDGTTVERIGLSAPQVRYVDGVLSAPVSSLLGTPVVGSFTVRRALDQAPTTVSISTTPATTADLAASLAGLLGLSVRPTDDDRLLVVPAPPAREEWSWLWVALSSGQTLDLDASTAQLLGNVALASHGETIHDEVLGSADASVPFQQFTLRKKPVTALPGAGGVADSSLTVRLDGVAWTEVPSLYGRSPRDQVYVSRVADDGATTVVFGDGVMGARPLTGHDNVVATYRQGSGTQGRVPAHTLTTLLDRPTGVKKVDNPFPGEGGADPESVDRSRTTAPGTVRTFGRAVSLRDFEDSALTQGEIANAKAAWVWAGHRRVVHLTVAGEGGASFSPAALARIAAILDSERDVNRPLLLGTYNPVAIRVEAQVTVDPHYVADDVLARVRAAVVTDLSFEHRAFAAAVHLSDLYAVMQDNAGVVGIDIDVLDLKRSDPAFRKQHGVDDTLPPPSPRILVLPAYWSESQQSVVPAELACLEEPALDLVLRTAGGRRP
jgi:Baseplate J-like protein